MSGSEMNVIARRAHIYFRTGKYNEAVVLYTLMIEINPNNFKAYLHRARAHFLNGRWNQAMQDAAAALSLEPNCDQTKDFITALGLLIHNSRR